MELNIDREALLGILAPAASCAGKTGPERLVVLRAKGNTLTVEATNTEISLSASVACNVEKLGELAVDASDLLRTVQRASASVLEMARVGGNKLRIRAGGAVTTLPCVEEWVALPPAPIDAAAVTLAGTDLARLLRQVSGASAVDDARYGLNGIHFEVIESAADITLRAVATDGHRLHRSWVQIAATFHPPAHQLVPAVTAAALAKLIEKAEMVTLSLAHGWGRCTYGDAVFGFRLIDGEFPDYEALVPRDHKTEVRIDVDDLVAAIRRSDVASGRQETVAARVDISGDAIRITRRHSEGREFTEHLMCVTTGAPMSLGINADYLREAAVTIGSDTVTISGAHPLSPLLIHSDGAMCDAVVMPMRLDV